MKILLSIGIAILMLIMLLRRKLLPKPRPRSLEHLATSIAKVAEKPSASIPRLKLWSYSHGGFTGAAIELLKDPVALQLVRNLTPASFTRVGIAAEAPGDSKPLPGSGTFMRLMENNPVLAAFGTVTAIKQGYGALNLRGKQGNEPDSPLPRVAHNPVVIEMDVYLDAGLFPAADALLSLARPSEPALDEAASALVHSAAIAHGSLLHVLLERGLGVSQHASVLRASGGATPSTWLAAYTKAVRALAPGLDLHALPPPSLPAPDATSTTHLDANAGRARALLSVFIDLKSTRASPGVVRLLVRGLNALGLHVWGVGSFKLQQLAGLLADRARYEQRRRVADGSAAEDHCGWQRVKQLDVVAATPSATAEQGDTSWAEAAVPEPSLRPRRSPAAQTKAESPRSFDSSNSFASSSGDNGCSTALLPPPLPFHIFTSAGEVQRAAANGTLPTGASVLFNGGTLLLPSSIPSSQARYILDDRTITAMARVQVDMGLKLGYYVQEAMLDAEAAALLIQCANDKPNVFAYGCAYGNLSGTCAGDIKSGTGFLLPGWLKPFVNIPSWKH